jgi:ribonucleoside-diphosphate reductase beta chain
MAFAFEVIGQIRQEEPDLFDTQLAERVKSMILEAVDCETQFAEDVLGKQVIGMTVTSMRQYLEFIADQRLTTLGIGPIFGSENPFHFMELQDVQELTNFFERRVSSYQVGVSGDVSFDMNF